MNIGTKVKVVFATDEMCDQKRLGQSGIITAIHHGLLESDVHCGESLKDPAWFVTFDDGHTDFFWTEELAVEAEADVPPLAALVGASS